MVVQTLKFHYHWKKEFTMMDFLYTWLSLFRFIPLPLAFRHFLVTLAKAACRGNSTFSTLHLPFQTRSLVKIPFILLQNSLKLPAPIPSFVQEETVSSWRLYSFSPRRLGCFNVTVTTVWHRIYVMDSCVRFFCLSLFFCFFFCLALLPGHHCI